MKKKLLSVILSVGLALCFPITAMAETVSGSDSWNVKFTPEEKMESTFKSSEMADTISGMQPGDTAIFTVKLANNNDTTTDWYMTNKVLQSLEDHSGNKGTSGGVYTYLLTYTDSKGAVSTIFDSETVGGDNPSPGGIGLHQATNSLEDFFYLDTFEKGKGGTITLKIELDGETQGNDYQDTLADLQMNFAVMMRTAGERDDHGGDHIEPKIVRTGDEFNRNIFYIISAAAGLGLIALAIVGMNDRRKQQKGGRA